MEWKVFQTVGVFCTSKLCFCVLLTVNVQDCCTSWGYFIFPKFLHSNIALHWKYIPMFVTVVSVPTNHEHRIGTALEPCDCQTREPRPSVRSVTDLYCWSMCAFSIRLSLARLFWNHILIWVSVSASVSASSNRLLREMYSLRWYSNSSRNVCSLLNVVLCLRGLPSFLRRLATAKIMQIEIYAFCDVAERTVVILYRRFGTACPSLNVGSELPVYAALTFQKNAGLV
jgi:hypothetical protein